MANMEMQVFSVITPVPVQYQEETTTDETNAAIFRPQFFHHRFILSVTFSSGSRDEEGPADKIDRRGGSRIDHPHYGRSRSLRPGHEEPHVQPLGFQYA